MLSTDVHVLSNPGSDQSAGRPSDLAPIEIRAIREPPSQEATQYADRADRIAHVVLSLEPGGLERVVCDLAATFTRGGQRVVVCCLDEEGRLAPSAREAGVEVALVRRRAGLDPGLVFRLARWFRKQGITVVHTHGPDPMFYGGWGALLAGVPVRIHTQHDTMIELAGWRVRIKYQLAAAVFTHIVAVSERTRNLLETFHRTRERLSTVQNGIDEARFGSGHRDDMLLSELGISPDDYVIGTVARLAPEKALDRLIRAFGGVRSKHPRCHLVIVGDGPERARLESTARECGISGAVTFAGHRERIERLLQRFQLFVLPSLTEGIPIALLEAMAAAVPVIATAVGGVPEVVVDGRSGVLVPPDDIPSLRAAMLALLEEPDRSARLGREARQRIRKRFSLSTMAAEYGWLYGLDGESRRWVRPLRKMLAAGIPRRLACWRGSQSQKTVSLTIDDGPDPVYTPAMLDLLRAHGVTATFFLIGDRAAAYPELVARIAADGHEIGSHSQTHADFAMLSLARARREVADARRVLSELVPGDRPLLFRPPFGRLCVASTLAPWLQGETVVMWSIDFKDFRATSRRDITRMLPAAGFRSGDIILYHGVTGAALEALPAVFEHAARQGLSFVPVSAMCRGAS